MRMKNNNKEEEEEYVYTQEVLAYLNCRID
jgi:hypothetical protein